MMIISTTTKELRSSSVVVLISQEVWRMSNKLETDKWTRSVR